VYKCVKLAERDDVPKALIAGTLCSLEDIKLGRILTNCIKPMYVD